MPNASGDETAFAQDAGGRELARGATVEILGGEDAGTRGRVRDVAGNYVTVELPDGSALRTSASNVRSMSMFAALACPYCAKQVALDAWSRLGAHRVPGGVCDGSGRGVLRADVRGRAVLVAQTFDLRPGDLRAGDSVEYRSPRSGRTVKGRVIYQPDSDPRAGFLVAPDEDSSHDERVDWSDIVRKI